MTVTVGSSPRAARIRQAGKVNVSITSGRDEDKSTDFKNTNMSAQEVSTTETHMIIYSISAVLCSAEIHRRD